MGDGDGQLNKASLMGRQLGVGVFEGVAVGIIAKLFKTFVGNNHEMASTIWHALREKLKRYNCGMSNKVKTKVAQ